MEMQRQSYVLFPSHADGIALEKILRSRAIKYTIAPTPRELSKCCGISIMVEPEDVTVVEELLKEHADIRTEGIYTIEKKRRNWFG